MGEIEEKFRDFFDEYEKKLKEGVLPPDPLRTLAWLLLEDIPEIEHALPVPPLIETIHKEITVPLLKKLPEIPGARKFGHY